MERSLQRVRLAGTTAAGAATGRVTLDTAAAVLCRVRCRPVAGMQCHRAEVIIGSGRHGEADITEAAVRRRVNTAEAETRHRRREIEVRRDGTECSRIPRMCHVQIITAWQTCLDHRLQTVHKQLGVVLVLCSLAQQTQ